MFSKCDYWMIDIQKRRGKKLVQVLQRRAHRVKIFVVFSDRGGTTVNEVWGRKRIHVLDRGSCDLAGGERFRGSKVIRESAEEIEKVLFSHESRILTPGGGTISPGGAGPPASPSSGHYHPPTHSPPLVKVSDILPTSSVLKSSDFSRILCFPNTSLTRLFVKKILDEKLYFLFQLLNKPFTRFLSCE